MTVKYAPFHFSFRGNVWSGFMNVVTNVVCKWGIKRGIKRIDNNTFYAY